jgi:hypothetical protein
MDKLGEDINWSALAAEAFKAEVDRRKVQKAALRGKAMEATIERLQTSKKQHMASATARGRLAGIFWARSTGSFGDLSALGNLDLDDFFDGFPGNSRTGIAYHEYLAWNILGPSDHTHEQAADFWRRAIDNVNEEDLRSLDYLRGFSEGAREVYEAVEKKM